MANLLTRDEEKALGITVQAGLEAKNELAAGVKDDAKRTELEKLVTAREEAVNTFFEYNLALVKSIAAKQHRNFPTSLEYEDLVQDGVPGLLKAIDKFDPHRGLKFSTMATWWIRQAVTRSMNSTHRTIRLPENKISEYIKINRIATDTGYPIGDARLLEEVNESLGLSPAEISEIMNAAHCTSLDRVVGSTEGTPRTLMNIAEETHRAEAAEDEAMSTEMKDVFSQAIENLGEGPAAIVFAHFGLANAENEVLTQKQVRTALNITQGRLKEILASSLLKLRDTFDNQGYEMQDFLA